MKRIFLLEDDKTLGRGIAMALTGAEASVVCRPSLEKAREALEQERFELLILDVNLPDGSGAQQRPGASVFHGSGIFMAFSPVH